MPVSLKDIAQSLHLSVATVSRALNNQGRISPKTRARVLKAMEQMHYRPNEAARALREKSSHTIGIIVPDIGNEFYARMIKGAERVAWKAGYALVVMSSIEEVEREQQTIRYMLDKRVAGLVLALLEPQCPMFEEAVQYGIPIAFVDNLPAINASYDSVVVDNRLLTYQMVKKLISMGHKRIAMLTYPSQETSTTQRQNGYLQAMQEAQLEPNIITAGYFGREQAADAVRGLLASENRPTAVFAVNNHMAYGAMDALRAVKLSVPEDMSLCCFDAMDSTGLMLPQLTSINQPADRFGAMAVNILLRKLASPEEGMYERLILEPEMQWGGSISAVAEMQ